MKLLNLQLLLLLDVYCYASLCVDYILMGIRIFLYNILSSMDNYCMKICSTCKGMGFILGVDDANANKLFIEECPDCNC